MRNDEKRERERERERERVKKPDDVDVLNLLTALNIF